MYNRLLLTVVSILVFLAPETGYVYSNCPSGSTCTTAGFSITNGTCCCMAPGAARIAQISPCMIGFTPGNALSFPTNAACLNSNCPR